jgi:3-(3-hydroxy-phenyl)propionate hydroxylase
MLDESPLSTADEDEFTPRQRPGASCMDAPVSKGGHQGWLLESLGWTFKGLYLADQGETFPYARDLADSSIPIEVVTVFLTGQDAAGSDAADVPVDSDGLVARYYDGRPGTFYLIRPDQHVAGRWRKFSADKVRRAVLKATAQG